MSTGTSEKAKYIPPHLRNKQPTTSLPKDSDGPSSVSTTRRSSIDSDGVNNNTTNSSSSSSDRPRQQGDEGRRTTSLSELVERSSTPPPIKVQFFGDSFIRLFSLVEGPAVQVKGFKGGTAKGIGRTDRDEENKNCTDIRDRVLQARPERLVFCFGSVDVHLSYFYNKVQRKDMDYEMIANQYVDWINNELTKTVRPENITIVGVYPSPLEDADVKSAVSKYTSTLREHVHLLDYVRDVSNDARQGRVRQFNSYLQTACNKYGFTYDDVCDEMLDPKTNKMKDSFRDVSSHNIHIVWETTILLWMDKWTWLRELKPDNFDENLQKTFHTYVKTKPWAKRTHVASSMGVRNAFDRDTTR